MEKNAPYLLGVEIFRNMTLTVNKEVLFSLFSSYSVIGGKMILVFCTELRLILSYEEGHVIVS